MTNSTQGSQITEMTDIPTAGLAELLNDLLLQKDKFEILETVDQGTGLWTVRVREKSKPIARPSAGTPARPSAGTPAGPSTPSGFVGAGVEAPTIGEGANRPLITMSSDLFRRPNGPVIMALQLALIKVGQAMEPDGDFGKITVGALRRWQKANGFPERDAIDVQQWHRITGGPAPSIFDLCLNVTADYEGTRFDRVVGNFDGAGITFGLIGFTLANGEIRRLLTALETLRPGIVANAFGALYPELMSILAASKAEQLSWADNISLGAQKVEVAKPWKDAFQRVGQFPEGRRVQIERAYAVYWAVARQHLSAFMPGKALTDQDAGFWFDVAVQNSLDKEERAELTQAGQSGATGEGLRVKFAEIVAAGSSPKWRKDVLLRKKSFVDGRGSVHGSDYQLSDWGIIGAPVSPTDLGAPSSILSILSTGSAANEELFGPDEEAGEAATMSGPTVIVPPEISVVTTSPHANWPLYTKFVARVATIGLRHFLADELLTLGSQNTAGACKGLNDYPPEDLWGNILPTAAVLDKLREDLNASIHILSVYRAPAYNKCIDGSATNSFHMRFKAIDFVCDVGTPSTWAAKLREYRVRGVFSGGIGVYKSFVHVDTRGVNANWTG